MARPSGGEIGRDPPAGEEGEIGLVAIAGVGRELVGRGAQVAPDRLDQGGERAAIGRIGLASANEARAILAAWPLQPAELICAQRLLLSF